MTARRLLAPLLAAALTGGAARAEVPLPGPGPRAHGVEVDGLGKLASNASCAGCHEQIAREWTGSLHREAWIDPVFRKAYDVEPLPFCRKCHAPESDPAAEPTALARAVGVGCTTCHVQEGHVVSSHPGSAGALHPVLADARLATPAACASCHQFDFPAEAHQRVTESMQDTVAEHARSSAAATPCQSCHMPTVDGPDGRHKSHAFSVIADPAMIRRAAHVTAERIDAARLAVTISPAQVGHSFPTGDMFRRLEVRAEALDARGRVVATAEPAILGRIFRDQSREPFGIDFTFERVSASDTRVPPPGVGSAPRIVLAFAAPVKRVRWRVLYQRMSTPMAEAFGVSQVLDEIVVAEGELAPSAPRLASAQPGASR